MEQLDYDTLAKRIGHRLHAARESAGLSMNKLAKAAGIDPRSVSGAEKGTLPTTHNLLALTKALELQPRRADFRASLQRARAV